ncbi:hypothetical protein NPIL_326351, partial [Nephila pilipes]
YFESQVPLRPPSKPCTRPPSHYAHLKRRDPPVIQRRFCLIRHNRLILQRFSPGKYHHVPGFLTLGEETENPFAFRASSFSLLPSGDYRPVHQVGLGMNDSRGVGPVVDR